MSACIYNTPYSNNNCKEPAGVNKVYIRTLSASTTYTYSVSDDSLITGGTDTRSWYTIEQKSELASFLPGTAEINRENGAYKFAEQLDLVFHKYQSSLRTLVLNLVQNSVEIIVLTNAGNYFLMGQGTGADVSANASSIGKVMTDLNGSTVTLTSSVIAPSRQCSAAFIATQTFV